MDLGLWEALAPHQPFPSGGGAAGPAGQRGACSPWVHLQLHVVTIEILQSTHFG